MLKNVWAKKYPLNENPHLFSFSTKAFSLLKYISILKMLFFVLPFKKGERKKFKNITEHDK